MAVQIVKLGGSLMAAPQLRDWLRRLADSSAPLVIVPGGGPFADAVRQAQSTLDFSDRAAHAMALLAMQQYAWLLADLEPRLIPALGVQGVQTALAAQQKPLWLPCLAELNAAGIPANWDITSDSLALWLANQLMASAVWLIKSAPIDTPDLVDTAFAQFRAEYSGHVKIVQASTSHGWPNCFNSI